MKWHEKKDTKQVRLRVHFYEKGCQAAVPVKFKLKKARNLCVLNGLLLLAAFLLINFSIPRWAPKPIKKSLRNSETLNAKIAEKKEAKGSQNPGKLRTEQQKEGLSLNMRLAFQDTVPQSERLPFLNAVFDVAKRLSINPNWLMGVMYHESKLNPRAVNSLSGATGLIQFMPATARGLGTNIETIRGMNRVEQMELVYKYLKPYKPYLNSYGDVYRAVFYPNLNGKFAGTLTAPKGAALPDVVYRYNKAVDMNGDGVITVGDIDEWAMKLVPKEFHREMRRPRYFVYYNIMALTAVLSIAYLLT